MLKRYPLLLLGALVEFLLFVSIENSYAQSSITQEAKSKAQQLFYDGFELLKNGRAGEAVSKFQAGLKLDPSNTQAKNYLKEAKQQATRSNRPEGNDIAAASDRGTTKRGNDSKPTYEDTVAWLQGVSGSSFIEDARCEFTHAYSEQKVRFSDLATSGLSAQFDSSIRRVIIVNCAKNGACVATGNSKTGSAFFWFKPKENTNEDRIIKALRHLAVLCGATERNENAF